MPNYLLKTGHHPPVGVYIAVMGGLAAILTFRTEPSRVERAAYIVLITLLMVAEIQNLYVEAGRQTAEAKKVSDTLDATNRGLGETLAELSGVADRLKGLSSGITEAIKTETGADSLCYLDFEPALNDVAVLTAMRIGKYPLRGVTANILDRAKIQAATDAYLKSRKPEDVKVRELGDIAERLNNYVQKVGDFATPTRYIGGYQMTENDHQSFDIIFRSFNAEWIERYEMRRVDGKWIRAIMIEPDAKPPCFKIDPNWPRVNGELDLHNWPRPVKGKPAWDRENSSYCFTQK